MTTAERVEPPLRPAEGSDEQLVFQWRNDPWIVSLSTNRRRVSREEHAAWFRSVLGSPERLLFIVESGDGTPAGTVRLDRERQDAAVLTIYLIRSFTGRGLGPRAIEAACRASFQAWPLLDRIVAYIRADNQASRKAFARSGFSPGPVGDSTPEGHVEVVRLRGSVCGAEAALRENDIMNSTAWSADDQETVRYFDGLVDQYGGSPQALDWGSRASQQLRFRVLAGVGELNGASVLDVGCGQGDFLEWLNAAGLRTDYTGLDITPKMIECCRERFPHAHFEVGSLLDLPAELAGPYDFVVASGIFYRRRAQPVAYMQAMMTAMFRLCRVAAAFNTLSGWAPQQDEGEFYADPIETLAYCRTLTPRLNFRHDYHARDFSVFLYK
jgi:RimJ/RimL family protein N-acetyltransferase/SAM-dependent methyltransferase